MRSKDYPYAYENKLVCLKSEMIDINPSHKENEIRVDLCLEEKKLSIIWGRIVDDNQKPINEAIVTLLKPQYINKRIEYIKIDTVLSDMDGFYQFEINEYDKYNNYLVIFNK